MGAQNTDLLLKVASNTGWQLGASGIPDAEIETAGLVSAAGLPQDTAVLVTIDRVDQNGNKTPSKMERVIGVVSGDNLVSCLRGVEGTAQGHSGGAVVEIVICASNINKLMQAILAEHNQDGSHGNVNAENVKATGLEISSVTWENLIKGWFEAGEAWAYVATNKFKIEGVDLTAKYTKGAKIKLINNSVVKYFYVVTSVFSTDTTVTVTGEVDLVDSEITLPFYSYNDCPQGFKRGEDWYRARVYRNAAQTANEAVYTKILYDTENYDPNNNFASSGYTAPVSGYYNINTHVSVALAGATLSALLSTIDVNSVPVTTGSRIGGGYSPQITASIATDIIYLNKGDVVTSTVYQSTGANRVIEVVSTGSRNYMSIQFVGV